MKKIVINPSTPKVLKKKFNSSYDNRPTKIVEVWSLQHLITSVLTNEVNPDPITQRPQVPEPTKSQKILEALINDGTFGAGIILRDIQHDTEAQKLYPLVSYLIIDGGHRTRALVSFSRGKIPVVKDLDGNNISFNDLDTTGLDLENEYISVTIYTCTSEQARDIFRSVNKVTQTNFMEDVMADEISEPCRKTRELVRPYKEYRNTPHKLFSTVKNRANQDKSVYFDGEVNPRNKHMEYVMIAIIKAQLQKKNNPNAGDTEITSLSEQNEVTKTAMEVVKRFLDDCVKVSDEREQKWNTKTFALFQLVWFGHYAENKNFVINDYKKFSQLFVKRWAVLTDTSKDDTFIIDKKPQIKTKWFFKNIASFSTGKYQQKCYEMFKEDMSEKDLGIIFRDEDRSISRAKREKELALQGYVCFLDGKQLSLNDSVWGHDEDWAGGGSTLDGKVVRKGLNQEMGQLTLEEFKEVLKNRKNLESAVA
tara:strand:- start:492 stop:1928 length:1437 start_codon:yes stop_codon:yes gene_type:complete